MIPLSKKMDIKCHFPETMSRILMTSLWAVSCHFYHREDGSDGSWRPPLLRCSISELSSFMSRCTLPCADTKVCHIILNDSWQLLIAWSFSAVDFFWLVVAETEQKVNDDSVSSRSLLAMPESRDIDLVSWRAFWHVTVREAKVQIIKWQKFHLAASVSGS